MSPLQGAKHENAKHSILLSLPCLYDRMHYSAPYFTVRIPKLGTLIQRSFFYGHIKVRVP